MRYSVKKTDKGWIVINQAGRIANDHTHKTKGLAENHMKILEAFFGIS